MVNPLPAEIIEQDRLCSRCGYNLRGLSTATDCAECGRPVADSPPLRAVEPDDRALLRARRRGATWLIWGILLLPLVWPSLVALPIGVYRVTGRWPWGDEPTGYRRVRRLARGVLLAGLVSLLLLVVTSIGWTFYDRHALLRYPMFLDLLWTLSGALIFLGGMFMLRHVRHVAAGLGAGRVWRAVNWTRGAWVASIVAAVLMGLGTNLADLFLDQGDPNRRIGGGLAVLVLLLCGIGIFAVTLLLLTRLRAALTLRD